MEELRVSVRELVEFTLHGADIRLISGRMQDMLDGTLGHQARQKLPLPEIVTVINYIM